RGVSTPLPGLGETIALNLLAGRRTNPEIRCVGISLDTSRLEPGAGRDLLRRTGQKHGLPCVDPLRTGVAPLVDALLAG
ncbi:MAG: NAD-dependent epimerase/dehydratase family protein, partial [Myxococcales bacterium]|nr:NAD-dependent epimerase/dehydratase family protein [Myxococcales bacterium]